MQNKTGWRLRLTLPTQVDRVVRRALTCRPDKRSAIRQFSLRCRIKPGGGCALPGLHRLDRLYGEP
ncbi:hypothetical protein C3Z09_14175 [Lelliottia aquatilis]|nr:hypothetical protein C3Z09_14175 [Lelliottia aquatilis]